MKHSEKSDISDLPDWVPGDVFREFVDMRKKIRKPLTPYAVKLAVGTLEKLKKEGHDPKLVLEQSILNCWQGLFAVKNAVPLSKPFKGVK